MPIHPLPASQSPRDDESLAGRRGLTGGSRSGLTPPGGRSTSAAHSDADGIANALPPALYADDSRGYVGPLNDVRERAARLAGDLDQLEAASDALARVQRLAGRLRDAAVVGTDGALQPAHRAALQRQLDLMLAEIDSIANGTRVEERLLRGARGAPGPAPGSSGNEQTFPPNGRSSRTTPGPAPGSSGNEQAENGPAPFRAIGTDMLGLTGLAVRSTDQASAATSILDRVTSRLQRTGRMLDAATARVQQAFDAVTDPPTTVAGDLAIHGETNALGATIFVRSQLVTNPDTALRIQSELNASRVRWLLDGPSS